MTAPACCLNLSRILLFFINGLVTIIGFAGLIIGIWAVVKEHDYTAISGSTQSFNSTPILLIVIGLVILVVGILGFVGAICGGRLFGRVLLMIYAVIVSLTVLVAIAGAIVIAVEKDKLTNSLRADTNATLVETPNDKDLLATWEDVQNSIHCCGVDSYKDWLGIKWFNNVTTGVVPQSCCATFGTCGSKEFIDAKYLEENSNPHYVVYGKGCVDAIIDTITDEVGPIIGVSVAIIVILVAAVFMACFVACCRSSNAEGYTTMA